MKNLIAGVFVVVTAACSSHIGTPRAPDSAADISHSAIMQQIKDKSYIGLTTAEKSALVKSHSRAFQTLNEKVRDPFITKGPDDYYYLTGTTAGSHWGETIGIRLWRSRDFAEWEDLGFVWDLYKDGKQNKTWHFEQKIRNPQFKNPRAIWAPEIHYMNGTWWIPHCMNINGHGLLRSVSGKPEGPYEALPPIKRDLIDAHIYQEDGRTYYMWQADYFAEMNADMTALIEEPIRLQHDGNHEMAYEGILLMKVGDKYLFIGSGRYGYEPTNTYDLFYGVSKNIRGPYGKRRMMIKNAGHGNLIQGPNGKWWATAFDHDYTTNIDKKNVWSPWLVPIEIIEKEDDVLIHVKDERFRPTQEDHDFIKKLSITGKPKEWYDVPPWTQPDQLEEARERRKNKRNNH